MFDRREQRDFDLLSDANALANVMIWMLKRPKVTHAMGKRNREKVLREHTIARYLGYVNELYDRAGRVVER
jgi:hypothetical protein